MNVQTWLRESGVSFNVIGHAPTYDAQRMAQALHVSGDEVAKTVLLRADGGYLYVVAILPASRHIDLEAASAGMGNCRLELASEIEIGEHCPDCEFGALPPFGSRYGMKTIVDSSLALDEELGEESDGELGGELDREIVFEGNNHHESIRMKFADFRKLENPLVFRFAR